MLADDVLDFVRVALQTEPLRLDHFSRLDLGRRLRDATGDAACAGGQVEAGRSLRVDVYRSR